MVSCLLKIDVEIPFCVGLKSEIITTVPACSSHVSSGTLTNVLPHRNAIPQTQDTTPRPVTVYRHGAELSLCYPLIMERHTGIHRSVYKPSNRFSIANRKKKIEKPFVIRFFIFHFKNKNEL